MASKTSTWESSTKQVKIGMSDEDVKNVRDAFDLFDHDHDGRITKEELANTIKTCGLRPSEKWVQDLMREADTNRSGTIEWHEFLTAMAKGTGHTKSAQHTSYVTTASCRHLSSSNSPGYTSSSQVISTSQSGQQSVVVHLLTSPIEVFWRTPVPDKSNGKLKDKLAEKDGEIHNLRLKLAQMEESFSIAQKRVSEMERSVRNENAPTANGVISGSKPKPNDSDNLQAVNVRLEKQLAHYKNLLAETSYGMSEEDIEKYHLAFGLFDKDGDGRISKYELANAIEECGFRPTQDWVQQLILEADNDGSGTIEWPEFLRAMNVEQTKRNFASTSHATTKYVEKSVVNLSERIFTQQEEINRLQQQLQRAKQQSQQISVQPLGTTSIKLKSIENVHASERRRNSKDIVTVYSELESVFGGRNYDDGMVEELKSLLEKQHSEWEDQVEKISRVNERLESQLKHYKVVYAQSIYGLTEEEIEKYRQAFQLFDQDRDGMINKDEMARAIQTCGFKPSESWVQDLIHEADSDDTGTIKWPEFLKCMTGFTEEQRIQQSPRVLISNLQNELVQEKQTVERLANKLRLYEEEIERLKQKESLNSSHLKSDYEALRLENESLNYQLIQTREEKNSLDSQFTSLRTQHSSSTDNLSEELNKLRRQLDAYERARIDFESQIRELIADKELGEQDCNNLKNEIQRLKDRIELEQKERLAVEERNRILLAERDERERDASITMKDLATMRIQAEEWNRQRIQLETRIQNLISENEVQTRESHQASTTIKSKLDRLSKDSDDRDRELHALQQERERLVDENSELLDRLNSISNESKVAVTRITQLESSQQSIKMTSEQEMDRLREMVDDYRHKIAEYESKIHLLSVDTEEILQRKSDEVVAYREKKESVVHDLQEAEMHVRELKELLQQRDLELEDVRKKSQVFVSEVDAYKLRIESLLNEKQNDEKTNESEIERLKQQLKDYDEREKRFEARLIRMQEDTEKSIKRKSTNIHELTYQNEILIAEKEALTTRMQELTDQIADMEKQHQKLLSELRAEMNGIITEKQEIEIKIHDFKREKENHSKQAEDETKQLLFDLEQAQTRIQQLDTDKGAMEKNIYSLKNELDQLNATKSEEMRKLTDQLNSSIYEKEIIETKVSEYTMQCETQSKECDTLKSDLAKGQETISYLKAENDKSNEKLRDLNERYETLTSKYSFEIEQLNAKLIEIEKEKENSEFRNNQKDQLYEAAVTEKEMEVGRVRKENATLQSEIDFLKTERDDLVRKFATVDQDFNQQKEILQAEKTALSETIQKMTDDMTSLKQTYDKEILSDRERFEIIVRDKETIDVRLSEALHEKEDLAQQCVDQLNEFKRELDSAQQMIDKLTDEKKLMEKEIVDLKELNSKEILELREYVEKLTNEKEIIETRIVEVNSQKESLITQSKEETNAIRDQTNMLIKEKEDLITSIENLKAKYDQLCMEHEKLEKEHNFELTELREHITILTEEKNKFEIKNKEIEKDSELKVFQASNDRTILEEELNAARKEMDKLQVALKEFSRAKDSAEHTYKQQLETVRRELELSNNREQKLKDEIDTLVSTHDAMMKTSEDKCASLDAQVSSLTIELRDFEMQQKKSDSLHVKAVEEQLSIIEDAQKKLEKALTDLQDRDNKISRLNDEHGKWTQNKLAEIDDLKCQIAQLSEQLNDYSQLTSEKEERIISLTSEYQVAAQVATEQHQALKSEQEKLRDELNHQKTEYAVFIQELEKDLKTKTDEVNNKDVQILGLESQNIQLEQKISEVSAELDLVRASQLAIEQSKIDMQAEFVEEKEKMILLINQQEEREQVNQKEMLDLRNELNDLKSRNHDLIEDITNRKSDFNRLEEQWMNERESIISDFQDRIYRLEKQNSDLMAIIEEHKNNLEEMGNKMVNLQSSYDEIVVEKDSLLLRIKHMSETTENLLAQVENDKKDYTTQFADLSHSFNVEKASLKNEILALENKNLLLETQIGEMKEQVNVYQVNVTQYESQLLEKNEQSDLVAQQLVTVDRECQDKIEQLTIQLDKEKSDFNIKLGQHVEKEQEFANQIIKLQSRISELMDQLADSQKIIKTFNVANEDLKNKIIELEEKIIQTTAELETLEKTKQEEFLNMNAQTDANFVAFESEKNTLKSELERKSSELIQIIDERDDLKEKEANLKNDLLKLEAKSSITKNEDDIKLQQLEEEKLNLIAQLELMNDQLQKVHLELEMQGQSHLESQQKIEVEYKSLQESKLIIEQELLRNKSEQDDIIRELESKIQELMSVLQLKETESKESQNQMELKIKELSDELDNILKSKSEELNYIRTEFSVSRGTWEKEKSQLQSDMNDMEYKYSISENNAQQLRAEVEKLHVENDRQKLSITEINEVKDAEIANLVSQVLEQDNKLRDAAIEHEALVSKSEIVQSETQANRTELETNSRVVTDLQKRERELQDEIDILKQEVLKVTSEAEDSLAIVNRQLEDANQTCQISRDQMSTLSQQLESTNLEREETQREWRIRLQSTYDEKAKFHDDLMEIRSKLSQKESEHESKMGEMTELLSRKDREIEELKRALKDAEQQESITSSETIETINQKVAFLEKQTLQYKRLYAQTFHGLSESEIDKYWKAFKLFDRNGDGSITKDEIGVAIKACGMQPSAQWVQDLIAEADKDDSDSIEWPEFLKAMTGQYPTTRSKEDTENLQEEFSLSLKSKEEMVEKLQDSLRIKSENIDKLQSEINVLKSLQDLNGKTEISSIIEQREIETREMDKMKRQMGQYRTLYALSSNWKEHSISRLILAEKFYGLSTEEIQTYWKAFQQFDNNQDGSITRTEIANALRACGLEPEESWVQTIVEEGDEDGVIQWPEFLRAIAGQQGPTQREINVTQTVSATGDDAQLLEEKQRRIEELEKKIEVQYDQISDLNSRLDQLDTSSVQVESHYSSATSSTQIEKLEKEIRQYQTLYAQSYYGLSEAEIDKYWMAFQLFDKDGDGSITKEEIAEAIKSCGLQPNARWVQDLVMEADRDNSGSIEWPEFLKAITGQYPHTGRRSYRSGGSDYSSSAVREKEEAIAFMKNSMEQKDSEILSLRSRIAQLSESPSDLARVQRVIRTAMSESEWNLATSSPAEDGLTAGQDHPSQNELHESKLQERQQFMDTQLYKYKSLYAQSTYGLAEATIEKYYKAFQLFDKNGDGHITKSEMADAIRACGMTPSEDWVQSLISEADEDQSGTIEWPEFLHTLTGMDENYVVTRIVSSTSDSNSQSLKDYEDTIKRLNKKIFQKDKDIRKLSLDLEAIQLEKQSTEASAVSVSAVDGSESSPTRGKDSTSSLESELLSLRLQVIDLNREKAEYESRKRWSGDSHSTTSERIELESLVEKNAKLEERLMELKTAYAKALFGLTDEEISRYKQAFNLFDKEGNGCITKDDIHAAIKACGLQPSAAWVQDLLTEADNDDSGTIEWPEFLRAMTAGEAKKKKDNTELDGLLHQKEQTIYVLNEELSVKKAEIMNLQKLVQGQTTCPNCHASVQVARV